MFSFKQPAWARYHITKYNSTIHVDEDALPASVSKSPLPLPVYTTASIELFPWSIPAWRLQLFSILTLEKITDENGAALKYEKQTSRGFLKLKVYVPGAVDTTRTVNIEYTVANATRFFEERDEFYWNVTGNDWLVPIDAASAIVFFPANASGDCKPLPPRAPTVPLLGPSLPWKVRAPALRPPGRSPFEPGSLLMFPLQRSIAPAKRTDRTFQFVRSNPVSRAPAVGTPCNVSLWWIKGRDPRSGHRLYVAYV